MPPNTFDMCAGGSVGYVNGRTSVTLTNHRPDSCNIYNLNLPNPSPAPNPGPPPYYVVPGGGSLTITFDCVPGRYPYSSPCCDQLGQPVIIVQGAMKESMGATPIPICDGGKVQPENGKAKIVLQNDHDHDCSIKDLNLPNANPPGPYKVTKKSSSPVITFDGISGKQYKYTPDCCGKIEGNPVIIVQ